MDELTFLRKTVRDLNNENLNLRSEVAYLKGKVEVYERYLGEDMKNEQDSI